MGSVGWAEATTTALFLDGVGEVAVELNPDGISWVPIEPEMDSTTSCCLSTKLQLKERTTIKFSAVYAVDLIDQGSIHEHRTACNILLGSKSEMNRFVIHGVVTSKDNSPWTLFKQVFGHNDLNICKYWVEQLNAHIGNFQQRPKRLLVFVHPLCGKGNGQKNWKEVAPLFDRAKVQTKVTLTQRAGHAYDVISSLSDKELSELDGVVVVGGDGLFNEILNGLLISRHKTCYPPRPEDLKSKDSGYEDRTVIRSKSDGMSYSHEVSWNSSYCDDSEPLLSVSGLSAPYGKTEAHDADEASSSISFPNDWFRLGLIPSGSTDSVVLSTTGVRDAVTSAMQIIFGRKLVLDIAQIVRWKVTPTSEVLPNVRYAASFAGYGFYGEVVRQSEKYRWMGPARYDFTGTMVFLQHRAYEAEVAFLKAEHVRPQSDNQRPNKLVCRRNCTACSDASVSASASADGSTAETISGAISKSSQWIWSKGRFLSVGGAIISCRNEKAPGGLVVDAHLADGFLHLILIKDCPHISYLWHLTRLAKGADPFGFKFTELHKTRAFTFSSPQSESVWNLDGEIFQASEVSVQVCRGLINLFASGPEL